MFKKILLTLLTAGAISSLMAQSEERVKINQTTRENAIITFVAAVSCNDIDTIWEMLTPENQTRITKACGNEEAARKRIADDLAGKINDEQRKKLRTMLANDTSRQQIVASLEKNTKAFVKIGDKWFADAYQMK